MSAWKSPANEAVKTLGRNRDGTVTVFPEEVIDVFFGVLSEPDAAMLAAGAHVLSNALAGGIDGYAARRLAEAVWHAMLVSAEKP